jgi:hypothetical protein
MDKLLIKLKNHLKLPRPLLFIAIFAILGAIFLFSSRVATPFASLEPEQGTLSRTDRSLYV